MTNGEFKVEVREQFVDLTVTAGSLMLAAAWAGSVWILNQGMGLVIAGLYVAASTIVIGRALLKEY